MGCLPTALIAAVAVALFIALVGVIGATRYLPLVDDVRSVRESASDLSSRLEQLEPADLDRTAVDELRADVSELEQHIQPLQAALDDPLVMAVGVMPEVAAQLDAADSLMSAADALVKAADIGLGMASEVVTMREANASSEDFELIAGLVELIATSADEVDQIEQLVTDAEGHLDAIGDDAASQILEARDLMAGPLETYRPLLEQYRELDELIPEIMGWGGEKRYLVLAQNPAELRPAGGYTGTVGIIAVKDGTLTEQQFVNVYDLDLQKDLPFIEPPEELTENLLAPDDKGNPQSWRLADATWSADFPTGAATAAEFYAIEAEGVEVDGVIALTTDALDRLLEVVGPVRVPAYDVIVEPGNVNLTLLGATRGAPGDLKGRKDVLDALAREVTQRLMSLPPEQWGPMVEALEDIGRERMVMIWLVDDDAQQAVLDNGLAGQVRQDPGDYLYVVESNVAPTSKYNIAIDRSDSLVVQLDEKGNALNSLRLDWENRAGDEGEPYQTLREASENEDGWYGAYTRILTPAGSELQTVRGESEFGSIGWADREGEEAGRQSYGNYILMTPGESTLSYLWSVPGVAVETDEGWEYRLVIQKQPGARPFPASVRINLPDGATVVEASDGATVDGDRVRYEADLDSDIELRVLYQLGDAG